MQIDFLVDGRSVKFSRDPVTGRAEIKTNNETVLLQDPLNPATHFSFELTKTWTCSISGAAVVIEKTRPLLLAGLRPNRYRVLVNDELIVEKSGY